MSKRLNKILVTSASLLMMLSVGVGASQVINPTHASRVTSRIAKLRTRRSHDYKDIKAINSELARLEKHTTKYRNTRKSSKNKKMYKLGEQQANNCLGGGSDYANDAAMIRDGRYLITNKAYSKGWHHSKAYNADLDEAGHTKSIITFYKYHKNKAFVKGYNKSSYAGGIIPSNNAVKHSMFALGEYYATMGV